jgi:hypothetical protein
VALLMGFSWLGRGLAMTRIEQAVPRSATCRAVEPRPLAGGPGGAARRLGRLRENEARQGRAGCSTWRRGWARPPGATAEGRVSFPQQRNSHPSPLAPSGACPLLGPWRSSVLTCRAWSVASVVSLPGGHTNSPAFWPGWCCALFGCGDRLPVRRCVSRYRAGQGLSRANSPCPVHGLSVRPRQSLPSTGWP